MGALASCLSLHEQQYSIQVEEESSGSLVSHWILDQVHLPNVFPDWRMCGQPKHVVSPICKGGSCQMLAIYLLKKHTVAEPYLLAIHLSCLQFVITNSGTGSSRKPDRKTDGDYWRVVFFFPQPLFRDYIVPFRAGWTSTTLSGWMSCIYPPNWSRESFNLLALIPSITFPRYNVYLSSESFAKWSLVFFLGSSQGSI